MKIQQRYCQGLSASWYSQQRMVEEDTASATPRCTAPRASPGTRPLATAAPGFGGKPTRQRLDLHGLQRGERRRATGALAAGQPGHALLGEPTLPRAHRVQMQARLPGHPRVGAAPGRMEHDVRADPGLVGVLWPYATSSTVTPGGGQRYQADGSNEQGGQADQQKWILPAGILPQSATPQPGRMAPCPPSRSRPKPPPPRSWPRKRGPPGPRMHGQPNPLDRTSRGCPGRSFCPAARSTDPRRAGMPDDDGERRGMTGRRRTGRLAHHSRRSDKRRAVPPQARARESA